MKAQAAPPAAAVFPSPQPAVCRDDRPRRAAARAAGRNGLDVVEVDAERARLTVLFLTAPPRPEGGLRPGHFALEGGRPGNQVRVVDVRTSRVREPGLDECAVLTLDRAGDGTSYTLRLVGLEGIDPLYESVEFSFRVDCPVELDCLPASTCAPADLPEPDLDHLAKDYASFRRLILDRLALIMPAWRERHVPDIGIALVELLAYVGDHLSYYQDAVATEAYLDTARQRTSVRRHARLVDYDLHDGCNARAWVHVDTNDDLELPVEEIFFAAGLARPPGTPRDPQPGGPGRRSGFRAAGPHRPEPRCGCIGRTTGSACTPSACASAACRRAPPRRCWSTARPHPHRRPPPRSSSGTPSATSRRSPTSPEPEPEPERVLDLDEGDLLLFEEVLGPETGVPADADRPTGTWCA